MTDMFDWQGEYEIGITDIDQQHQHLFAIAREFEQAKNPEQGKHALIEVYQYTREHFHLEEEFMKKMDYPGYDSHKAQHDQLIDRLNELSYNYKGDMNERGDIMEFFSEWIVQHICHEDHLLAVYSKQH